MRTNKCTFVTLDTICRIPFWNKCGNTTFLKCRSAILPSTVLNALECAYREQVAVLCVDWEYQVADELWHVVVAGVFNHEVRPSCIYWQFFVFATTVNGLVVHVYNLFALAAVALNYEFLHLFNSQVDRNNLSYAEECRLENCVGAVAQTNLLCNLGCVDVVN